MTDWPSAETAGWLIASRGQLKLELKRLLYPFQTSFAADLSGADLCCRFHFRHGADQISAQDFADVSFAIAAPQHFIGDQRQILGAVHTGGQEGHAVKIRADPNKINTRDGFNVVDVINYAQIRRNIDRIGVE